MHALVPYRRATRRLAAGAATAALLVLVVSARPAEATGVGHDHGPGAFQVTNLVADQPGVAPLTDPDLVNPWGLALGPTTPLWVSDADADVSTIYRGAVDRSPFAKVPLTVSIPGGAPTGQVYNANDAFVIHNGAASAPARFLFASESGHITGWSPDVPPANQAQTLVSTPGAIYKGLALAETRHGPLLYATDFHGGKVDMFDGQGMPVMRRGAFTDPFLPPGYAPFGIAAVGNHIVVTYAKQDADREDDVAGPGNGFVDVYSRHGHLLRRLASRGVLNAPWGLALAPAGFGRLSGQLLVGNFGDGTINAFSLGGFPLGALRDSQGARINVEGLWGLQFGNGTAGSPTTLFFAAGPGDEEHGLLGTITPAG
jgi:uncharacterized protein (TIGR03118 family)